MMNKHGHRASSEDHWRHHFINLSAGISCAAQTPNLSDPYELLGSIAPIDSACRLYTYLPARDDFKLLPLLQGH